MSDSERKYFLEMKQYHESDYRKYGYIRLMSEYIQDIMKYMKPGIPSETKDMQEMLRIKLLQKARTRSEMREKGELPEEKPKVKRVRTTFLGPSTEEYPGENGAIIIKVIPGRDPYEDIDEEEDINIDLDGQETASEDNADEESAHDLSIIMIDSLANVDKEKVKNLWKEMADTKAKEAKIYNELSGMVEDMTPAVIQETFSRMTKPGTNIPQCIEEMYEEIGDTSKFKKIVVCGYMMYEMMMKNKNKKYKKKSLRKIAEKFGVDQKGIMQIKRGAAYGREQKKLERRIKGELKTEIKEETPPEGEAAQEKEGEEEYDEMEEEDEETDNKAEYGADLGTEEADDSVQDPSGTSFEQPGYSKGGSKRKREEPE